MLAVELITPACAESDKLVMPRSRNNNGGSLQSPLVEAVIVPLEPVFWLSCNGSLDRCRSLGHYPSHFR